jgi:hypothetical protein
LWRRGQWRRSLWLAPIPLSMLAFLTYASVQFGDWQAPLEINLDIVGRIQVLADVTYLASWPDNIRGELILMLVLFSAAAIWQIRKLKVPAGYCLTQLLFLLFVYGRDWPRYALAFTPILFALALQNVWKDRVMRWVLLPAAVLGVAWSRAAIPYNLMKEPDALLRHLGIGS